jgi:2-oxoglutarate ferredoxin oxidoreductase subunit gamma
MENRILVAGFGGQGVMIIGKMLAEASWMAGKKATFLPVYGPEQRGGTANCTVTISDEEIGAPDGKTVDTFIALNDVSLKRFLPRVKSGGTVIVNASICSELVNRDDVDVCYITANDTAKEIGNEKVANMVIIGAFISKSSAITEEQIYYAIEETLGHKSDLLDLNKKALKKGIEKAI